MRSALLLSAFLAILNSSHAQNTSPAKSPDDSTHFQQMRHTWHQRQNMHYRTHYHDSLGTHTYHYAQNRRRWQGGDMRDGRNRERGYGGYNRIPYTPEQRKQVAAIRQDYSKKRSDLYKNDNLTLGAYKTQLRALTKEEKSKLQALLTPEQKSELQRRRARAEEDAQVRAAAKLERLRLRLKLNDQQVAAMKSQQQSLHTQMLAIRQNDELLPIEKREQLRSLAAKRDDAIKAILTAEQYSEMQNMYKRRYGRS